MLMPLPVSVVVLLAASAIQGLGLGLGLAIPGQSDAKAPRPLKVQVVLENSGPSRELAARIRTTFAEAPGRLGFPVVLDLSFDDEPGARERVDGWRAQVEQQRLITPDLPIVFPPGERSAAFFGAILVIGREQIAAQLSDESLRSARNLELGQNVSAAAGGASGRDPQLAQKVQAAMEAAGSTATSAASWLGLPIALAVGFALVCLVAWFARAVPSKSSKSSSPEKRVPRSAAKAAPGEALRPRAHQLWQALADHPRTSLLALVSAATLWSLDAPFYLDAVSRIALNPDLRSLGNLFDKLIYPPSEHLNWERNDPSRPVVFAVYTLLWAVSPNQPIGFRLANLAVHALNALLAFAICRRVLRAVDDQARDGHALAAAALFGISTVNVGTAIYTYALNDVLATTFMLAALLTYARWRETSRSWPWGAATFAALFFGLFSKQSTIVMPLALMAYDFFVLEWRTPGQLRAQFPKYIGLFALCAVYLLWRKSTFGQVGDIEASAAFLWDRWAYLGTQAEVVLRYAALLLIPFGWCIDHALSAPVGADHLTRTLLPWVIVVALLAGIWRLAQRRSPWHATGAFSLCWFILQLAPTSSLMPTVDLMVERRVYGASLGFYLFLVLAAAQWSANRRRATGAPSSAGPQKLAKSTAHLERSRETIDRPGQLGRMGPNGAGTVLRGAVLRVAPLALGAAVLVSSLGASVQRSLTFRDPVATWHRVLELYPDNLRATASLASSLLSQKHYAEAVGLLERLIRQRDYSFTDFFNLGTIYETRESGFFDPDTAVAMYEKTLKVNPGYTLAFFPLAKLLQIRDGAGDAARARELYLKAISAGIEAVDSLNNLGLLEAKTGNRQVARSYFEKALQLNPEYARARSNLALLEAGRL